MAVQNVTTIGQIFDIPDKVYDSDFVLSLTAGISDAPGTVRNYVVTPELAKAFDEALSLIEAAIKGNSSKGDYLHGSFGSGKSHFMAILTLLLDNDVHARSIPELAEVVGTHNRWTQSKRVLVVPYHMIGAKSMESAIFSQYADFVANKHPGSPTPGFYRAEALFESARNLRQTFGDQTFFEKLSAGESSGWGKLGAWTAERFDAAVAAAPGSEDRVRLVSRLVDTFFKHVHATAADGSEGFVSLDEGLEIMSRHAQDLGYNAIVLFLDELILWLASHASDTAFVTQEGEKVAKLVEATKSNRPIPIVSFIAKQRDLRELVGEHLPGADQLRFADVLNWWEARFGKITLEDRNLPVIASKRLLRPKSDQAARLLQEAFDKTAKVRDEVMSTLLTRSGSREEFRLVYPFSPALVQALIALSTYLQRERTALKLMSQLLVERKDTLALGDIVPVGDLFDVIMAGDEPFMNALKTRFEQAKRLYRQKLVPMLESMNGVTRDQIAEGSVDPATAKRFRDDDRLLKTLVLAALAPEVEALKALTPARLAALNHGTVKSPIPGQESQLVLQRVQNWAAQVGEIKISDDGPNPTISLQLVGVDTEAILDNARSVDNHGSRAAKIRSLLYGDLGLPQESTFVTPTRTWDFWGTRRTCEVLLQNIRELPPESLEPEAVDAWRVVIGYPIDQQSGFGPRDSQAQIDRYLGAGRSSNSIAWLPSFLNTTGQDDLGKLVILDHVLQGQNLKQYSGHLSEIDREQARQLLTNQRDQIQRRVKNALLEAYGISQVESGAVDRSLEVSQHFQSLNSGLKLKVPVGADFGSCLTHLLNQALSFQFPDHPKFETEVRSAALRKVLDVALKAAQARDGRVEVDKTLRDDVRKIAVPLTLGDMGETHFVLRDDWKQHFGRKKAESQTVKVTARQLRQWTDEPNPRGLPRNVQNLLILAYAQQTNCSFFLHGGPVQPQLDSLDDAVELREQTLPAEATWKEAVRRGATLFGVPALELLSAGNVTKFVEDVEKLAKEEKAYSKVDRYVRDLRDRLERRGLKTTADRLKTAQAAHSLLGAVLSAGGNDVVATIATAAIATSEAAMGQAIRGAEALSEAIEKTDWELFDTVGDLDGAPEILSDVDEALQSDEHARPLASALKEAKSTAMALLQADRERQKKVAQQLEEEKRRQEATAAELEAERKRKVAAEEELKKLKEGAGLSHVVERAPAGQVQVDRGHQAGIAATEAIKVIEKIKAQLQENHEGTVDLDWAIYTPSRS